MFSLSLIRSVTDFSICEPGVFSLSCDTNDEEISDELVVVVSQSPLIHSVLIHDSGPSHVTVVLVSFALTTFWVIIIIGPTNSVNVHREMTIFVVEMVVLFESM